MSTSFLTDFLIDAAVQASNNSVAITYRGLNRYSNWKFRKKPNRKATKPEWHDATCESLKRDIGRYASLLKDYPNNAYLRGQIQSCSKKYKKLLKSKQKEYVNKLFEDLDNLHNILSLHMLLCMGLNSGYPTY